jgi:hypothetical protein
LAGWSGPGRRRGVREWRRRRGREGRTRGGWPVVVAERTRRRGREGRGRRGRRRRRLEVAWS